MKDVKEIDDLGMKINKLNVIEVMNWLAQTITALEKTIENVHDLHVAIPCGHSLGATEIECDDALCDECGDEWPCNTILVLNGHELDFDE